MSQGEGYEKHRWARSPTTSWTMVTHAQQRDTPVGKKAFAELCERYSPTVYAYIRQRRTSSEDAADLTQDFFARMLRRDDLAKFDPSQRKEGARFRGWLKTLADSLLVDDLRWRQAQKRGGGQRLLSFDAQAAESTYAMVDESASPEDAFHYTWACVVRDRAVARLKTSYLADAHKAKRWTHLHTFLFEDPEPGQYQAAADALDMTVLTARVAVNRMRKKLRDYARDEAADTVSQQEHLETEAQWLTRDWPALE